MKRRPTPNALARLLRRGRSQAEIAAHYGVHVGTVEAWVARWHLGPERSGLIRLPDLARELGVTRQALSYRVGAGELRTTPWGTLRCFDAHEAQKARALFALPPSTDYPGWLNTAQAARAVGLSEAVLSRMAQVGDPRLSGVRHVRVCGVGGYAYRFCPGDLPGLARVLGRRALPERYSRRLNRPALAELLGVPESRLSHWTRRGAPYAPDRHGRQWFDPSELSRWLASGVVTPRDLPALLDRLNPAPERQAA